MPKYVAGHKPQYKQSRWANYEYLREQGFLKAEARELSKNTDMKSPVINEMVSSRHRLVNRVVKESDTQGWSEGKENYEFAKAVRGFYRKNKLVNVAGSPDVRVFYHQAENKAARKRGWKKGEYDRREEAGESDADRPRRRPPGHKKDYKPRKGNVDAQKARAKARAGFYKRTGGKLRIDILEREYRDSFKLVADAKTPDNKRDMIDRQRLLGRRLTKAQKTGAKFG